MVIVSEDACPPLKSWLKSGGYTVRYVTGTDAVYPAISKHADIYYCRLGDDAVKCELSELSFDYPGDCAFNGVYLDGYFIHNRKCTAKRILRAVENMGLRYVHVNQGYTKCSTAVIDGAAVISSDGSISRGVSGLENVECLRISPGNIRLPGMECGFIGGACGRVGKYMLFNGDITKHPDCEDILAFIRSRGVEPVWFEGYELTDIGSIIECRSVI